MDQFTYTLPRPMAMMMLQLSSRVTPAEFPGLHSTLEQQFSDQEARRLTAEQQALDSAAEARLIAKGWKPPEG